MEKGIKIQSVTQFVDVPSGSSLTVAVTFSELKEIYGLVSYTDDRGPWNKVNSGFYASGNVLYISLYNKNTKYGSGCQSTFTVVGK